MENRTGLFSNGVIWFGVAVSVSEIEAGIQLASSSPIDSIWIPLILGHIIGGILLFFTGLVGARLRVNAMETIKSTFGDYGSKFFSSFECYAAYSMGSCAECTRCSSNDGIEFTDILHSNMHNSLCNNCNMGLCWTLPLIKSNHCNDGGAYNIVGNPIL